MSKSRLAKIASLLIMALMLFLGKPVDAGPTQFLTTPHPNVSIEWWYLFAHVQTKSNRHLALVISFFRFGSGSGQDQTSDPDKTLNHYLLCGVTDEDTGQHTTFSLADKNSLGMMQAAATLALMVNPHDQRAQALEALASKGELPKPSLVIPGSCVVKSSTQIDAKYGDIASLKAVPGQLNTYSLTFNESGKAKFNLIFHGLKPPMQVGGTGLTGIATPSDMHYLSLTRTSVTGTITTGSQTETVESGQGWFDHQWGSSWTPTAVGWDWFGLQLSDGRDILLFRQRHLTDGSTFGGLATIEDKEGHLTVTHNVQFVPDASQIWTSSKTGVKYPLGWTVDLPDANLDLTIIPKVLNQELPALGNTRGAIWEGSVSVHESSLFNGGDVPSTIPGVGYMELVGYGAPAVAATVQANPTNPN